MLYGKADTLTVSRRYCEDDRTPPAVDSMVEELAGRFALAVRRDIAPEYRAEDIRILESRDGITKEDREAFKTAIRLTKTDVPGACDAFAALEATNPADVSVLFNIGLCHESAGDLDQAEARYRTVLGLKRGKFEAQAGLDRIASRLRAERQMALHVGADPR
jgi:tetratricopeptide (TPR) repeat protein